MRSTAARGCGWRWTTSRPRRWSTSRTASSPRTAPSWSRSGRSSCRWTCRRSFTYGVTGRRSRTGAGCASWACAPALTRPPHVSGDAGPSHRLSRVATYVVRVRRGGPWDFSRDMREQTGWDEHAKYMDDLFDSGFVLFAGPLEGGREVLWIVNAESEEQIRERMAEDPWAANGMLRPELIERWTVVLDALKRATEVGRGL